MTRSEIYTRIAEILVELFEIEAEKITPQANLYTDLDIDSIDAIDLIVELKKTTGKNFQPDDFKSVRTIEDVVQVVYKLLNQT